MLLLITLIGPIRFLGGTADALKWAHCIGGCCYRLLCFGQLYFWKALPICSDGPMALADAAADCFAWAHQISGRHCRCTQMITLYWRLLLLFGSLYFLEVLATTSDEIGRAPCRDGVYFSWIGVSL